MKEVIELRLPNGSWRDKLPPDRIDKLDLEVARARRNELLTEELLLTQFMDKAIIVQLAGIPELSSDRVDSTMREAKRLRDALAHGDHYADTMTKAKKVCETVGNIFKVQGELEKSLQLTET
jgi:hypothetical protein